MAAPLELLGAIVMAVALLPLTASTFAYALVERRHRRAWARPPAPTHLGAGPYRRVELVGARLHRAPILVRAAALGCFFWSWFSLGAWVAVGVQLGESPEVELLALGGLVVAAATALAGLRLLRRDARAVPFGRHVAIGTTTHVALVATLATLVGPDLAGPAFAFGALSIGVSFLLVLAVRRHAALFCSSTRPCNMGVAPPRLGSPGGSPRSAPLRRHEARG